MKSFLVFVLLIVCARAEGEFAQAIFPEALTVKMALPGAKDPAYIEEVELHELTVADREALVKRIGARPDPRPEVSVQVAPMYPPALKKAGTPGKVEVYLVVGKDGNVREVYVSDYTHPSFAKSAALGLKYWRFKPRPNDALVRVPVPFAVTAKNTKK